MAVNKDYRKFKTPFFEIEIGDSSGQRMVKLPGHLLRLVEKIDILETFQPGKYSTITMTMVEGSREPASQDPSLGSKGLYNIADASGRTDMDISGSITNRTGAITDLRFSGTGGITFLSEDEVESGKISNGLIENVNGKRVSRLHPNENKKPIFLFQERNQIKVTWGYKEDPSTVRSVRGYIIMVTSEFPSNGMPRTTVTCHDTGAFLDQVAPTQGVPFGRRIQTAKGNSVVSFEDLESDVLIREICSKLGIPCIVSSNLPSSKLDKHHQKLWIAGESFQQFMNKLADKHNAHFKVVPDPKTGIDTLIFINKKDFESKPIVKNKALLDYKSPGTILKSVGIKADFGTIGSNSKLGVDEEGNPTEQTSKSPEVEAQLFKSNNINENDTKREVFIDYDPTSNNPVKACKTLKEQILDGDFTGVAEYTPNQSEASQADEARTSTDKSSRTIQISLKTIGFTQLTPGVVEVRGIGLRYSGKYRLLTVKHTITPSSYITSAEGNTYALSTGGTKIPEAKKGKEVIEEKESRVLFSPESNTSEDIQIRKKLDSLQGTDI